MVTADRLRELLEYDEEIGRFRRRVAGVKGRNCAVGSIVGGKIGTGYRVVRVDLEPYLEHRLVWLYKTGEWPPSEIDHRDRDRGNNRWPNLRPATGSQNGMNRGLQRQNTSGFKGVSWHEGAGAWRATINVNRHQTHLGFFRDPKDASIAYQEAAAKLHGEYATAA